MDQYGFGYDLECSLGPGPLVWNRRKVKAAKKKSEQSKQAKREMKGICL